MSDTISNDNFVDGKLSQVTIECISEKQEIPIDRIAYNAVDLYPREVIILEARYNPMKTKVKVDELAIRFDVSKYRIREIEKKALRKLRHPVSNLAKVIEQLKKENAELKNMQLNNKYPEDHFMTLAKKHIQEFIEETGCETLKSYSDDEFELEDIVSQLKTLKWHLDPVADLMELYKRVENI